MIVMGTVLQRYRAARKHSSTANQIFSARTNIQRRPSSSSNNKNNNNKRRNSSNSNIKHVSKERQVVVQCILYSICFVNCLIWSISATFFYLSKTPYEPLGKHFWITVLSRLFLPLQGLFNFFIYTRPNVQSCRNAGIGIISSFKEAIYYPESTTQERIQRAGVMAGSILEQSDSVNVNNNNGSGSAISRSGSDNMHQQQQGKSNEDLPLQDPPEEEEGEAVLVQLDQQQTFNADKTPPKFRDSIHQGYNDENNPE